MENEITLVIRCEPAKLVKQCTKVSTTHAVGECLISTLLGDPVALTTDQLETYGITIVSRSERGMQKERPPQG